MADLAISHRSDGLVLLSRAGSDSSCDQNVSRTPNWNVRGSLTAVIWLNVDTGLVG